MNGSIFTKVPGLYRTRDGNHVWVKYICDATEYPVIGGKVHKHPKGETRWASNVLEAYAIDGRCVIGKDQSGDIVERAEEQMVLWFKPMKGTPPPEDIGRIVLCRLPPREPDGFVEYQCCPYQKWMNAGDYKVEWAELPLPIHAS